MIPGSGSSREPLCGLKSSPGSGNPRQAQALSDTGLVPVQFARYLLVLDPVADRAAVGTGGRVATRKPVLDQRLHLWLGEPIAELHRRVARYGGEDPLLPAHPRRRTLHGGYRLPESSSHVAICQRGDHRVYPEGSSAEGLHLKPVDRELLERIGSLRCVLGWEFDHLRDQKRLYGGHPLIFGVGEPVEQGTLVGYVLIDHPRC